MERRVFYIMVLVLFFSCKEAHKKESTEVEPQTESNGFSWQIVKSNDGSEPIPRHEAAFVKIDDKFYLLGGRGIRPVSIYNPKSGFWSTGSKPPLEMHHFQPVVHEDKIWLLGAMTGKYPSEIPVSHIYIYNPAKDKWSKGDEIPEARRRGSTGNVIHDGKVYISCGIRNGHIGGHVNWLDSYDLKTGNWKILADAPRARDHFQTVLAGSTIYALAGRNSRAKSKEGVFGNTIAEVDAYDITSNTWKTLPSNLPTHRAGNASILFQNEILVVGGESRNQKTAHVEVEGLNPETQEWRTLSPLNIGRHGSGVLEFNGELFIASGSGNQGGRPELGSMEKFVLD